MFGKGKSAIIGSCLSFLFLFVLLAGFQACKDPSGQSFTVTFDTTGGSPIPRQITVREGNKIKEPIDITKPAYYLNGWYKDPNFLERWYFDIDVVMSDITLYARWNPGSGAALGGGGGGGSLSGLSQYSQIIYHASSFPNIDISITHVGSRGPQPRQGDTYNVTMEGKGTISSGTIEIASNGDILFIPDSNVSNNSGIPFIGQLNDVVLSIENLPIYHPGPPATIEHITIPGAVLEGSGIEGNQIAPHEHVPPTFESFIASTPGLFYGKPIFTFNNQDSSNRIITKNWIVGYREGDYGWEKQDMTKVYAKEITDTDIIFAITTDHVSSHKGRIVHGEWKTGHVEPLVNLHVEIADNEKKQLQFKGGGAPYWLDLEDDYGNGTKVGTIEITATGSTKIVTFKVDMLPEYNFSYAEVKYSSPTKGTGAFPITQAGKVFVYQDVAQNTTFTGATFTIISTKHPELVFKTGGSDKCFVDDKGIVILDSTAYAQTVQGYSVLHDSTLRATNGDIGWIIEARPLGLAEDEFYETTGSPVQFIQKSHVFQNGSTYYEIVPAPTSLPPIPPIYEFYYDGYEYYTEAEIATGTAGNANIIYYASAVPPRKGPTFIEVSGGPHKEDVHGTVISHAVKNYDLFVFDGTKDVPVGEVHAEYNRYEPDLDLANPEIPFSITVTYIFDSDFLDIMNNNHPTWDLHCNIPPATVTITPLLISSPLSPVSVSNKYIKAFKGAVYLPDLTSTPGALGEIEIELDIETSFTF